MTPELVGIAAPNFDLGLTLDCGQLFHWVPRGAGWIGLADRTPLYVEADGDKLLAPVGTEEITRHFFALDHPLAEIYATFPQDEAMQAALAFCRGMRLVRQPAWECLATFITSAMKQVPHIRQISLQLRRRYGQPVEFAGTTLYTYPTPERLAECTEAELRECKLGFRAKNLLGAAKLIAAGMVSLESIATMDDETARAELCRLPGVGEKVANCALLFGFERLRAFPIDVWIERILREIYFRKKRKVTTGRLRDFSNTYFGEYGGYAQQYLFHHARKTWKLSR
ncbi:MAG: DNA glycosylase [Chthoniobacteraceae bacterium]